MSADLFQWTGLVISIIGGVASVVLGCLAIFLSLYLYRRSNELFTLMAAILARIEGSTRVTETTATEIRDQLIKALIARITVAEHETRLRAAETLERVLAGAPRAQVQAAAKSIAQEIATGFQQAMSSVAAGSPDYDWRHFITAVHELEKNNRFLSVKFLDKKVFADDPGMREALQVAIEKNILITYQITNPKNPGRSTLCCKLNAKHPEVVKISLV